VAVGDERTGAPGGETRDPTPEEDVPAAEDLVRPADPPASPEPGVAEPGESAAGVATGRRAAFVDASALVALADRDDASHAAAVAAYRDLVAAGYALFTTNAAVTETFDLLRAGLGGETARRWLRDSRLAVYHADEADEAAARRLLLEAGDRRDLSLTEAINLAAMDRLGVTEAFAVDQRFLLDAEPGDG